jgi:PAS domain S-box-containing protein
VRADESDLARPAIDFKLIVEQSLSLVVLTDANGVVEYVNSKFCAVTGYSPDEVIGKRIHEFGDLEPAQAVEIWQTVSSGQPWRGEFLAPKKNGERYWVSSTISPVMMDGVPRHFLAVNLDITEQRTAVEALRTSEARLRALLSSAPIVLFAWDKDGRFLTSDGKGLEPLGREPGEVVGKLITEVYPEGSAVHRNYLRAMSGEVVVDVLEVGGRWWTATSTPVRDDSGEIIGVTGVAVDVTDRKQAELALEASQARLQLAFDHAQLTAWEWEIPSDEITDSVGVGGPIWDAPRPLSRAGFVEMVHEDDRARVDELVRRVLEEEGNEYDIELRIVWPDGSTHWVTASGILIRDEDGKPLRLSGIAMDITERKKAEEARRQGEERLRLALDGGRMMTWEWDVVADSGTHNGGEKAELEYLGVAHTLAEFLSIVAEDDRERVRAAVLRSVEHGADYGVEFRVSPAGAETRWVASRGTVVRNQAGEVTGLAGVAMDITESKRADEALRESEERYRALYQDNPAMYFTVALDGTVLSVNRFGAEQLGYGEDELVGRSVFDVFHKSDRAAVRRQFSYLSKHLNSVRSWEFRKVRKDGEEIWVREIVRATRDGEGQTIFLVVCEDITERHRMEELMQAMREQLEQRADRAMASGNVYNLSFREMTVLDQVADGKSDKEIGIVLGIRPMTVSKHVANVLKKMGAASRAEAGVRAWREGIIK